MKLLEDELEELTKLSNSDKDNLTYKNQIDELFSIQRSVAKNMILIIDAYDEIPSQEARFELVNFLSDQIENHGWPVVMTCRNSHRKELESAFEFEKRVGIGVGLGVIFP